MRVTWDTWKIYSLNFDHFYTFLFALEILPFKFWSFLYIFICPWSKDTDPNKEINTIYV